MVPEYTGVIKAARDRRGFRKGLQIQARQPI
jgi:hypothetical protein